MKTSKQIQATIDEKMADIQAIEKLIKEEEREPTAEETTAINAFYGTDDEDNPGELAKLNKELSSAKRREQLRREYSAKVERVLGSDAGPSDRRIKVPAKAKRFGKLEAFGKVFGDSHEALETAYISGQRILAGLFGNTKSQEWLENHGLQAAMSEGTNSAGGFTVDDELEAVVIKIQEEFGVLRMYSRPSTMMSDTKDVPIRTGVQTVYYPGENTAITASDLTLARAQLIAKKYATLTELSSELSEDSVVDLAEEIALGAGLALATAEDTNGFLGDGTGTYASVTGLDSALNANSIQTAASGNVSWATLDLADFEATAAKLPRFRGAQPRWYINSAGYFNAMVRLMNASGGTPGSEIASGYMPVFLGYPVVFAQVMPDAPGVDTNVCFFGDLSMSVYMGSRRGITLGVDGGGKYFEKDQVAVKATQRCAITIQNQDSSSAGPVVALATAAS